MTERELREPVARWLREQGLLPVHEFHLWHMADIVGVAFEERINQSIPRASRVVAVELKTTDAKGVLSQAKTNSSLVTNSYAAMPVERFASMREETRFKFKAAGIGLLAVDVATSRVYVEEVSALFTCNIQDRIRRNLWRRTR